MSPMLSGQNKTHGRTGHAVAFADHLHGSSARGVVRSDGENLTGSEFGTRVLLSLARRRLYLPRVTPLFQHVLNIVIVRSREQMRSATARWVVAVMKDAMAFRDRAYLKLIGNLMRLPVTRFLPNVSISLLGMSSRPNPARSQSGAVLRDGALLVDLFPESICQRSSDKPRPSMAREALARAPPVEACGQYATTTTLTKVKLSLHREPQPPGVCPPLLAAVSGRFRAHFTTSEARLPVGAL